MASSPANRRDKRPEAHRLAAEGDIDGSFSFSPPFGTEPFYYLYYFAFIFAPLWLCSSFGRMENERVHGQTQ